MRLLERDFDESRWNEFIFIMSLLMSMGAEEEDGRTTRWSSRFSLGVHVKADELSFLCTDSEVVARVLFNELGVVRRKRSAPPPPHQAAKTESVTWTRTCSLGSLISCIIRYLSALSSLCCVSPGPVPAGAPQSPGPARAPAGAATEEIQL